jgi:hypothetical protein
LDEGTISSKPIELLGKHMVSIVNCTSFPPIPMKHIGQIPVEKLVQSDEKSLPSDYDSQFAMERSTILNR